MAYVYCHIKADDGEPFYVGMGKTKTRPWKMSGRSQWHKNIVAKHGVRVEIIIDDIDWEIAQWWERTWIRNLRAFGYNIVNLNEGGEGQLNPSKATREKIASTHRGNKYCVGRKLSDETKQKISQSHMGKPANWDIIKKLAKINKGNKYCLGKKASLETRQKMSLSHKGNKYNLGRKASPEAREKMSAARKGRKNSPDAIEKTAQHSRKPVLCITDGMTFRSATEASVYYGMKSHCKIAEVCRGVRKTAAEGRVFKYIGSE